MDMQVSANTKKAKKEKKKKEIARSCVPETDSEEISRPL